MIVFLLNLNLITNEKESNKHQYYFYIKMAQNYFNNNMKLPSSPFDGNEKV